MEQQERVILKNLVALCFVCALNSLCFSSLQSLQSSLNSSKGLGLASLSCLYAAGTTSSLLISPIMIKKLGTKTTMIMGSLAFGLYAVSNFFPRFYIIIPAAILCGLVANPNWVAASTYLNILASNKAYLTNQVAEVLTNRYLALLQMTWQISHVLSTFLVSKGLAVTMHAADEPIFMEQNFSLSQCGARDCGAEIPKEAIGAINPPRYIIQIFLGCYSACGLILAPLVGIIFIDAIKPNYSIASNNDKVSLETNEAGWLGAVRALKSPHLLMLMPLAFFAGVHFSFVMGDFTKSFVSCTQGIHVVGYVIMAFASADAVANLAIGWIRQYVSRILLITVSGALTMSVMIICLVWNPETGEVWHLYVMAVVFGYGDAVWQLQPRVFLSVLFPDNTGPAFSAYYFFLYGGFTSSFAISIPASICVSYKIYALISLLLVSFLLYCVVEIRLRIHGHGGSAQVEDEEDMNMEKTNIEML